MCGIAGILTTHADAASLGVRAEAMRQALAHRGPDGRGVWQSPSGGAVFVHTRLSIFDPSTAGCQPMSTAEGRLTITYNGAIYNFQELRRSLERAGLGVTTRTDTEVILRAYQHHGASCVDQLRGMFAFAIWDEQAQTCVIARDRFGIKPVYYSISGGRLLFASEVRALLASRMVAFDLDPEGLYGYFRTGSVPEPRTLLRDVRCLEAGQCLTWTHGAVTVRQYAIVSLSASGERPPQDPVAATRAALLDSVDHHFAGDRPVAVFLSGGVDSTALVALAHAGGHDNLQTLSMSLPGFPDDEGPAAQRTAAQFGTRHHECIVTPSSVRALLPSFLAAVDQPSIDGLNTFVMSRFARDSGAQVVLSGVGADELFGGYPTFRGVPRLAAWHRRAGWTNPVASSAGRLMEAVAPDVRSRRVGELLRQPPGLAAAYSAYRAIFTRAESITLAAHYAGASMVAPPAEPGDVPPGENPLDTVSRLELSRYVRNQLLRDGDVMSMSAGVELRTPYLDSELVRVLADIPSATRLEAGKVLLVRAVPEIPAWVVSQPKRCFQFPFEQWLGAEWHDVFGTMDRALPVRSQTWYRKWCVFALDQWMRSVTEAAYA